MTVDSCCLAVLTCLVDILANIPGQTVRVGCACLLGYYSCMKPCLKCCASGMLTIASDREFQYVIEGGKYDNLEQFLLVWIVLNALLFK